MRFTITAFWDDETGVWVASNDDLGLATEAESLDTLMAKIRQMVQELVELNGLASESGSIPYDLLIQDSQRSPARA